MNAWFVKVGVKDLKWPAQSPSLYPTEHLMNWNADLTNVLVAGVLISTHGDEVSTNI